MTTNSSGIEYPSDQPPDLRALRDAPYGFGHLDLSMLEFQCACDGTLYLLQLISSDRLRYTVIENGVATVTTPHKSEIKEPEYPDIVRWLAMGLFGIPARFRAKIRQVNI